MPLSLLGEKKQVLAPLRYVSKKSEHGTTMAQAARLHGAYVQPSYS